MTLRVEDWRGEGDGREAVRAALRSVPWLPFRRGFGLGAEAVERGAMATLDATVAKGTGAGRVLVALRGDRVTALMALARHPFESEMFGIPMARSGFAQVVPTADDAADDAADALLEAAVSACAAWGCRHLSLLVPGDDAPLTRAAIRRRWLLADSTLDFTWDVEREAVRSGRCTDDVVVRAGGPEDAGVLSQMARETYTTSIRTRYLNDPRLSTRATGRLYAEWAERACEGSFADRVAVAEVDGRIVGFDMVKLDPTLSDALGVGVGRKGIAAVDPAARGRGITSCMEAFLNQWQRDQGGRFNSGRVLFNNLAMQHALAKVGGVVTAAYHTFHGWLGDQGGGGEA
ncbi:MAG: hypothetical protein PVI57_15305 [Gemmatimonadota bacterium]